MRRLLGTLTLVVLAALGGAALLGYADAAPVIAEHVIKIAGVRAKPTVNFTGATATNSGNTTTVAITATSAGALPLTGGTMTGTIASSSAGPLKLLGGTTDGASAVGAIIGASTNIGTTNGGKVLSVRTGVAGVETEVAFIDKFDGNGWRLAFPLGTPSTAYITAPTNLIMGSFTGTTPTGYFEANASSTRMVTAGGYELRLEVGTLRSDNDTLVAFGSSSKRWKRAYWGGTSHVAGDFALSAGWGNTASVGTITGSDPHGRFVVTSAGTGQGANPTITLTFKDGTFTAAPFCTVNTAATSVAADNTAKVTWVEAATTLTITWNGTPTATRTYTFAFKCDG